MNSELSTVPLSVVVSPSSNLALACAFDPYNETSIIGNPALFALKSTETLPEPKVKNETEGDSNAKDAKPGSLDLPGALIDGLMNRRSIRDVLLLADRLSPSMLSNVQKFNHGRPN